MLLNMLILHCYGLGGIVAWMVGGSGGTSPWKYGPQAFGGGGSPPLTAIGKLAGTTGSQSGQQNRGTQASQRSVLLGFLQTFTPAVKASGHRRANPWRGVEKHMYTAYLGHPYL